ncbi:PepSY-associated TM helix domain-containing protein [Paractinoplanes lichenicola]|uniref:PepSY domain-containing protein n=1 Tax=Paractinoplanes lichenicola TaxID=2802976 RepID=A0ABS1VFU9_9ACTN|nr:PepSY-associated TM helix domain-containing protein [Actinoplanes lichenicola]MBL7253564.1 PepSY domain-containing protein [Actinoplanes lichenicola]
MTATQAPPSPVPVRRRSSRHAFGPLLLRLHFYAGIFVAPFVLLAALTGAAYAFTPQIERAVYADELTVTPGGTAQPLSAQLAAARGTHPEGDIAAVRPGFGDTATQVDFTAPELDFDHKHTVYVNQYTGEVNGQLTTWWVSTPVRTWFDDLHTNLQLGEIGFYYSEFAASWLWVLALGGVALWWRRQRGKRMLRPDLSAKKGVRRTRGWHASTGLWLSVGLLFLSATGLTWSNHAGANFNAAVDALKGSRPAVSTELTGAAAAPAGGGHHGGGSATEGGGTPVDPAAIDQVMRVAEANGIGGKLTVAVPETTGTAWTVTEEDARWPVGRDSIAVDAATGTVTDRSDFADWPFMAKLTQWGIYAHMGDLFGLANQVVLALLAFGVICVIVWGYRMWWQRRPTRADRRAPVGAPLGERGAWQNLPPWAIAVGVPVVFGLAWVLPLFGIPLAAFIAVDLALAAWRGRRRPPTEAPVSPAPAGR